MRVLNFAVITGALASLHTGPACAHPTRPGSTRCSLSLASPWLQQQTFEAFLKKFYVEEKPEAAILENMSEQYIQHNPFVLSGRQNAIDYLGPVFQTAKFTIAQHSFSNSTGWVHTKMEVPGAPIAALVDIFRMDLSTPMLKFRDLRDDVRGDKT
ncbi:snoal-like polyketide cyclase family protein [Ilyonectria robusta]